MRILRDAQFAVRTLTRSPGFTVVVVLTLALGIGASTAIFTVVNAVVLRPLAYPEAQQLVRITSELRNLGATDTGIAAPELFDYQSRTDLFTAVAGMLAVNANVTSGDTPERVEMMLVSWNYFSVLGVSPAYGRTFGPQDDVPGVANIAVVSDGFWRRRLGADPQARGRTIVIDSDPIQVVGVMPPGFRHPGRTVQSEVDAWSPAGFRGQSSGPPSRSRRRLEGALARLQPGVTLQQAQARLTEYGVSVSRQFPADYPVRNGWTPRVIPLQDDLVAGVATPMFVLLAGVGLLLLVACVNVAHLVLARSSGRRQEIAIRQALGASGGRVTSQLATESAILAAAGGVLAVLVASWGLRGLIALAPPRVPRIEDVALDFTAVLVTAAIALAVSLLFAFVPAWQTRRVETLAALKEGGPGRSADGRAGRARSLLVAAEVAMATVLLVGAGLLVRSVAGLLNVPVGFETGDLLTARVALPRPNDNARATYLDPLRRVAFYRQTERRIAALPGVERVAMSSQIPLGGFNPPVFIEIDGRDSGDARVRPVIQNFQVSPGYFATMGVRILAGRPFTDADRAGSEPVAIVSETAARMFWKDQDPVGKRLRFSPETPWMTVIGVAGDVLNRRLSEPPQPILYRSLEQSSDLSLALLIRTRGAATDLARSVTREVRAVDSELPVYAVRSMSELVEAGVAQRQFLMRLLVAFGTIATALALLGIYGVMAYSVSQRTREIGIRMAIGARQSDVSRMVMRRGMALTAAGVLVGISASLALSRLIASQLFGVRPSDPVTLVSVLVFMSVVAAAAAYLPARRAARVDPVVALRSQ
jgi:putative ABC transport system permease protein